MKLKQQLLFIYVEVQTSVALGETIMLPLCDLVFMGSNGRNSPSLALVRLRTSNTPPNLAAAEASCLWYPVFLETFIGMYKQVQTLEPYPMHVSCMCRSSRKQVAHVHMHLVLIQSYMHLTLCSSKNCKYMLIVFGRVLATCSGIADNCTSMWQFSRKCSCFFHSLCINLCENVMLLSLLVLRSAILQFIGVSYVLDAIFGCKSMISCL